jgi:DNA excision repair protein ERCC-2
MVELMDRKATVKISVTALVEEVYKSGDLYMGSGYSSRKVEGIKIHHVISRSSSEEYLPEVPVKFIVERKSVIFELNGRIDGVIRDGEGITINEIKTVTKPLEDVDENYNMVHWAQAKCYAYIYGEQNARQSVEVQLMYYNVNNGEIKCFRKSFSQIELEAFFFELADRYLERVVTEQDWIAVRNESIYKLSFPFESYRKGQRELSVTVYRTLRDGGSLFAQAPTGIGKTIAALFPAIKAVGEGHISKIFYLTAKTITRTIAEKAFENMRRQGLKIKTVTITAKEKICLNRGVSCQPDECEYVRGYFDRINKAIKDINRHDSFTRPVIEEYAAKHKVCPFEFSLDLSNCSDCIICDYNYAFDPGVFLRRHFMFGGDYCLLVDEAHNLVDRAREMFSAQLVKEAVLGLKRETRSIMPELSKNLGDINSFMVKLRKKCEEEGGSSFVQKEPPEEIFSLLRNFSMFAEQWLATGEQASFNEELKDLYFNVQAFLRVSGDYDERYVTYCEKAGNDVKLKMFCLDPSFLLKQVLRKVKAAVFFSATLTPLSYFVWMLGGGDESSRLRLPSPFPSENLCLMVDESISTRYRTRENTYDTIAKALSSVTGGRTGNYLVFFPSYKYMIEVYARFAAIETGVRTIIQRTDMSEEEREGFLFEFDQPGNQSLLGFAVMGGIFGEGIDLVGDRLSGAIIVGVGLPQVCLEREVIRKYFDEEKGVGFEYAYIYPGMNKVMQAAGRVIRTENDRGVVLLIDERFNYPVYRELFPSEWNPVRRVRDVISMEETVRAFWNE